MTNTDHHASPQTFMRRAIELSRQGVKAGDGGPFGAVVVKDGVIVGEGWNQVLSGCDPTAHGEITAIRDAGRRLRTFDLKGCEIYTTGEPCPMCLCAIYWAGIDRVFYGFSIADAAAVGFDDRVFYQQISKPIQDRQVPETQLLRDEAFAVAPRSHSLLNSYYGKIRGKPATLDITKDPLFPLALHPYLKVAAS